MEEVPPIDQQKTVFIITRSEKEVLTSVMSAFSRSTVRLTAGGITLKITEKEVYI